MRHETRRCTWCAIPYLYQTSGAYCKLSNTQSRDPSYCTGCAAAIQQALQDIPKKREARWETLIDPTTVAKVVEKEALDRKKERDAEPGTLGLKVYAVPSTTMWPSGQRASETWAVNLGNSRFLLTKHYNKGEYPEIANVTIKVKTEHDLETHEHLGYWKEY